MSKFEAPLTKFEISPHENADSLSIAKIGDWQCVVRTEDVQNDTMGVYIPLDAVAAIDHPLLSFLAGKRVKTCKLGGVLSQGVLLPFSQVEKYMRETLGMKEESVQKVAVEGRDFAGILRIKRWIDPTCRNVTGDAEMPHERFNKYTDIENIKNYSDIIHIGEWVDITEKLHGTSARYALIDDKCLIGSRGRQLMREPASGKLSVWNQIFEKYNIEDKLLQLSEMYGGKEVGIYGEIVGPKIQDLCYGQIEPALFVYDLVVDGQYVSPTQARRDCASLQLPMVPALKTCQFQKEDLELRLGQSVLDNTHIREGIVIKPLIPRWDEKVGRVILKVISEDYLMRKNAKDIRE